MASIVGPNLDFGPCEWSTCLLYLLTLQCLPIFQVSMPAASTASGSICFQTLLPWLTASAASLAPIFWCLEVAMISVVSEALFELMGIPRCVADGDCLD